LQKKLKTKKGYRYKIALVKKKTLAKNQEERVAYKTEYTSKTIDEHWSYITFTGEAHINLIL
jgi:hypothetical protein